MEVFETVVEWIVALISHFDSKEIAFEFAFIILGFSVAVWWIAIYRPHLAFTKAVFSATRAIRSASGNAKWKPEDRLAATDKALAKNPVVAEAWIPYRGALRPDPKRPGQYVNPVDPYGWFSIDRLPGRGYEKWASTLAGVFLTVGLLFTFVGLSAALFKVGEAGSDTAQLRVAIADILRISSAKFITSMAGIVAYIGWTLVARFYASAQAKAVMSFASAVQALSALLTPEALLLDQLFESREHTKRLKTLSDDIAVAFDASLNKVVGERLDALPVTVGKLLPPALEQSVRPVVDAIQDMGGTIGAGNHAALQDMITGLTSGVKDATGQEMGMLTAAMREAAGELKDAKSGIGDGGAEFGASLARAADGMNAAAARMADAMEQRAGEIDARMGRIDAVLSSGAERFDAMGGAMSQRMTEGLRQAMEGIAAAAAAGAETARGQAQAELAPLLGELKNLMSEIRQSAEDSRGALVAGGRSAANDLGTAMAKAGGDLSDASARASSALVESFQEASSRILATVEGSVSGYRTATEALAARLAVVEQGFGSLEQAVRRNVANLDEASGTLTTAGRTFGSASEQLRQAAAPVVTTLQSVEAAATKARETLQMTQASSGAMREAAAALVATSQAAAKAFETYEHRFASVDISLGQTVAKLRDGVVELGNHVTEVVEKYDEHLAKAIGALRVGVEDIVDAVENLGDRAREPV